MNQPLHLLLISAVLACLSVPGQGAEPNGAELAATIAPFLDEQTIAVAHFDVAEFDVAWLLDEISDAMDVPAADRPLLAEWRVLLDMWRDRFRETGGRDAFIVLSLADLPRHAPYCIVPLGEGSTARDLAGVLISGRPDGPTLAAEARRLGDFTPLPFNLELAEEFNGAVFFGDRFTRQRLETAQFSRQQQLAEAFSAAGTADLQFVILLSNDQRRVLSEFGAGLAPGLSADAAELLGRVSWMSAGLKTGADASLEVSLRSDDDSSAARLREVIAGSLQAASRDAGIQAAAPQISDLARAATLTQQGDRLQLTLSGAGGGLQSLISIVAPSIYGGLNRGADERLKSRLKQIGLAMHNYHDVHSRFPPAASVDERGRKLLSWRVHILPYIGESELYKQFRLDEPWDSENNRKLIVSMPDVFAPASFVLRKAGKTTLLAPVGQHSILGSPQSARIRDITDGTSNTMLVLDAAAGDAVIWTKPDDLSINADDQRDDLFGGRHRLWSLFADGSVRPLAAALDESKLRAILTRDGGEVIAR